jgi:YVTN family beta-propeller protein
MNLRGKIMKMLTNFFVTFAAMLLFASGCGLLEGPVITKISPERAEVGEIITISGRNFGQSGDVKFGSVLVSHLDVVSWSSNKIKLAIPINLRVGSYTTSVRTAIRGSNTRKIHVKPADWLFYDTVVTNYLDGTINAIDFSTMEADTPIDVSALFGGLSPYRAIFDDEQRAYFALRSPDRDGLTGVAVIDYSEESNSIYGTLLEGDITSLAYDGSDKVILSDYYSQKLHLFDPFSSSHKGSVSLAAVSSAFNADVVHFIDGSQAWVINEFWAEDFGNVLVSTDFSSLTFSDDGSNGEDKDLSTVYDLGFSAEEVNAPARFVPSGRLFCDQYNGLLYFTGVTEDSSGVQGGALFAVDINDCDEETNLCPVSNVYSVGLEPIGMAIYPGARYVLVANSGSDSISIVDTVSGAVTELEVDGSKPVAVATSKLGEFIMTANFESDDLAIFELPDDLSEKMRTSSEDVDLTEIYQLGTIPVGDGPTDVVTAVDYNVFYPSDETGKSSE